MELLSNLIAALPSVIPALSVIAITTVLVRAANRAVLQRCGIYPERNLSLQITDWEKARDAAGDDGKAPIEAHIERGREPPKAIAAELAAQKETK